MQYRPKEGYSLPVSVVPPISIWARRQLLVEFPLPRPLLRAIGPKEEHDGSMWSQRLADWGWAWSVTRERCFPQDPIVNLWLHGSGWPNGFDPRVLALAVVLRLRVDGEALTPSAMTSIELGRVWSKLTSLSSDTLAEVLALATLRSNIEVFNFDSVAPSWPFDVSRVIAERRSLIDERSPSPVWLKAGYSLIGDGFKMLRSMGASLDDCNEIWCEISLSNKQTNAFEMAYWSEATHCLTERHLYESAEVAQGKVAQLAQNLERLTGLVDSLWHLQQGRLYYYAGNLELALSEFLRQIKERGNDLNVAAMLNREVANVLSDMACLEGARYYAEISIVSARSQGQQSELYKSLGRFAEICIKLNDLLAAKQSLSESISIQERLNEANHYPAQTLTYQGHLELLAGDFNKAQEMYDLAELRDITKSSNPYIVMGRFSLAVVTGNTIRLEQLWNLHQHDLDNWINHQTHILPATLCFMAAAKNHPVARERLPHVVRALIENRYIVEGMACIKAIEEADRPQMVRDIQRTLNRWQKTLASVQLGTNEFPVPLDGPKKLLEYIDQTKIQKNLILNSTSYPMNLLSGEIAIVIS